MSETQAVLGAHCFQAAVRELVDRNGPPPWTERIALTDHVTGVLICQAPGHPCDRHYHVVDEWWIVLQGEIDWNIEGREEPVRARAGDFVFVPAHHFHLIQPTGSEPTLRLAISKTGEPHRHER